MFRFCALPAELQDMILDHVAHLLIETSCSGDRRLDNRLVVCSHRNHRIFIDAKRERNPSWARLLNEPAMKTSTWLRRLLFTRLLAYGESQALPCPYHHQRNECVFSQYDGTNPPLEVSPAHSRRIRGLRIDYHHLPEPFHDPRSKGAASALSIMSLQAIRSLDISSVTIHSTYNYSPAIDKVMDLLVFATSTLNTTHKFQFTKAMLDANTSIPVETENQVISLAAKVADTAAFKAIVAGLQAPRLEFSRSLLFYSVHVTSQENI